MENNGEVISSITLAYLEKITHFYGLTKKNQEFKKQKFLFNQIVKLRIKSFSNLSNINICYYLKFKIPIMHRQFITILSQNPDYVKAHCDDLNKLFHFACRKFIFEKSTYKEFQN